MPSSRMQVDPEEIEKLAAVAVRVGLGLQPGQELILTAPMTALPLARKITEHAYKAGASLVTTLYSDEEATLARYRFAVEESFDTAADWLLEGQAKALERNAARLAIDGGNPMLLAGQDTEKVSRASRAQAAVSEPVMSKASNFEINWSVVAYPSPAWASLVFPDLPEDEAVARLAEAIFAASRVDRQDPVAAWTTHNRELYARRDWLNAMRFSALHFTGPGTDLTVGLADGHVWAGGAARAKNGTTCVPNIPTDEVATTPHARRVDGRVRATKPLSHNGTVVEDIEMTFREGRAVEVTASKGGEVLREVLATDDGARRLGEVALVPHSSPISQSGLLFYNTLFDENAACHIAMGRCYAECIENGGAMSGDELARVGGNDSLIHIDWMIGSADVDIDGITQEGERVPVFRQGEWAQ